MLAPTPRCAADRCSRPRSASTTRPSTPRRSRHAGDPARLRLLSLIARRARGRGLRLRPRRADRQVAADGLASLERARRRRSRRARAPRPVGLVPARCPSSSTRLRSALGATSSTCTHGVAQRSVRRSPNTVTRRASMTPASGRCTTSTPATTRRSFGAGSGEPLLTVPIVVTSDMVMEWFGYTWTSPASRGSARCSARSSSSGVAGRSWRRRRRDPQARSPG